MRPFRIAPARSPADIEAAAALFRAYAAGLEIDLAYQGFAEELAGLPGLYAPPAGELLLASGETAGRLGCVALRPFEGERICEMKRLYVEPAARGLGVGQALAAAIIGAARDLGYAEMRLDSLPSMAPAIALYRKLGFAEIPAYYPSPIAGTRYFSLGLSPLR